MEEAFSGSEEEFENVLNSKEQTTKNAENESHTKEENDEKSVKIEGLHEDINLVDITQILVSLCKLKVVKSELFELLELHFIKNLDKASAESIVSYAFAHSALCSDMLQKYEENKKTFLKRSIKNLQ